MDEAQSKIYKGLSRTLHYSRGRAGAKHNHLHGQDLVTPSNRLESGGSFLINVRDTHTTHTTRRLSAHVAKLRPCKTFSKLLQGSLHLNDGRFQQNEQNKKTFTTFVNH